MLLVTLALGLLLTTLLQDPPSNMTTMPSSEHVITTLKPSTIESCKSFGSPAFVGPFVSRDSIAANLFYGTASSFYEDAPSVADSDVSSLGGYESDDNSQAAVAPRKRLQWIFHGLTLWLEFEEYSNDLTKAIDHAVRVYGTERIPIAHATALYGMEHLTKEEAMEKLADVPNILPNGKWPPMEAPKGVTQDIAEAGKPGQICSIAWAELTLESNEDHEQAMDALYKLFEVPTQRQGPWTPHISMAYDNPEDSVLNLKDTYTYVVNHATLMKERRVKAISLWDTNGKMADWRCLDRVNFEE